ncbi:unnamed protein product [Ilex paraguariensis]|uniref:Cytochrome P450 n=1 Tax=Ilex paraguariensis TaxID=185542 RepID=A0ABC8UV33_9AQUA
MEWMSSVRTWLSVSFLASLLLLFRWTKAVKGSSKQRPPGPPGWPIVGNMFDLGTMPHQTFYKLRAKYGPVLWLKLGLVDTMVIQSAKAAAELFKNHDLPFSDRKVPEAITALGYNQGSLAFARHGPDWRILRRLCSMELLVNKRLHESAPIRQKCIDKMIEWIEEDSSSSCARGGSGGVELVRFLHIMAFNLVGNLMLSRDLLDMQSEAGHVFFEAMNMLMQWAGKPNVADFVPFLKWLDPLGIKRNMARHMGRCMKVVAGFIDERVHEKQSGREKVKKDFLNALLEYEGTGKEGPDKISKKNMNIIILLCYLYENTAIICTFQESSNSEMEWMSSVLTWLSVSFLASLLLLFTWTKAAKGSSKQRPPGPPGWPIVGNMFDLGTMPHQTFYKLRAKYGPVLWLKLGLVDTMVIQSAKAAAELFKNNDLPFSDRKVPKALTALGYNQGSLAMAQTVAYYDDSAPWSSWLTKDSTSRLRSGKSALTRWSSG